MGTVIYVEGREKMSKVMNPVSKIIKTNLIEFNNGQIRGVPKNPRKVDEASFSKLVKSIADAPEMLNLREIIVYFDKKSNKYVTICGNQRLAACKELEIDTIPCKILPENTPPKKLREYTIKDNIETGENDNDILSELWNQDELFNWGLEVVEIFNEEPPAPEDLEKYENKTPELPIIPQYGEEYKTVVIFARTEMEMVLLKNLLKLETKKSYKNSFTGTCYVLTAQELHDAIADNLSI